MKNKGLGHLKTTLFTIKTSKNGIYIYISYPIFGLPRDPSNKQVCIVKGCSRHLHTLAMCGEIASGYPEDGMMVLTAQISTDYPPIYKRFVCAEFIVVVGACMCSILVSCPRCICTDTHSMCVCI